MGDKNAIRFAVSDTGIGIAPEKHRQVFEAFSQADSSTTREYGGTGLGLSISARLVRLMGGEIGLESEPGKGSTFFFTLPLEPAADQRTPQPQDSSAMLGKRVLVLDDNEVNRLLLARMLPQWGLEPTVLANGKSAIDEFKASLASGRPYSLLLLDQHMPEMDGYEVAAAIRNLPAKEPVTIFMLSSALSAADRARGAELGIARYLVKPLRRSMLHDAILQAFRPSDPQRLASSAAPAATTRSLQILLVEDNRVNQELALRLLKKLGHRPILAVNGEKAIDLLRSHEFDLILMDIQMPVMGGVEATQQIRALERPGQPRHTIIAMTAHAMTGDAEKYLCCGMDGYISKPIRLELLAAEIDRCTGITTPRIGESMKPSGTDSHQKEIDLADLLVRVDNDRDLLRELLHIFKDDAPGHMENLRRAVVHHDVPGVASEAHTLKGMLSNLSCKNASATAASLEKLAREERTSDFAESFAGLEQQMKRLLREIENSLSGVPS